MRKTLLLALSAACGAALTVFALEISAPEHASAASERDVYHLLNLFGDVFERVRSDYVEKPEDGKLIEFAISGMLRGLDPHSSYMELKDIGELELETRGAFGGLGMEVTMKNGFLNVVSPTGEHSRGESGGALQ